MTEPMWKSFGHNPVCSIRRCGNKPTKRLNLAVVGTRKYGDFGAEEPWREVVGPLKIVVCDECYDLIHSDDPEEVGRPHAHGSPGLFDFLRGFVAKSMKALEGLTPHGAPPPAPPRFRLEDDRVSVTHKFNVGGTSGYATVGLYPDGSPGEIFVRFSKTGERQQALLDAWATMVSIGLQCGIPLEVITEKFKFWKFEPRGFTQHPDIRMADSPLDYICKWLEMRFGPPCDCEDEASCECTPLPGDLEETDNELRESLTPTAPKEPR